MSSIKETIKAEIKRLKKILEESTYYLDNSQQALGYSFALDDFKEFIDSQPEEKPSEDLEEAAYEYSFESRPSIYGQVDVIDAFIAGAEWERQQMLKGAKDGYVSAIIIHNDGDEEHYAVTYPNGERPHSITDKVKIIIL